MQTSGSRTRLVDRLIPTHIILYVYGRPRGEHPSFSARYHMKEEPMIEHPPFLLIDIYKMALPLINFRQVCGKSAHEAD